MYYVLYVIELLYVELILFSISFKQKRLNSCTQCITLVYKLLIASSDVEAISVASKKTGVHIRFNLNDRDMLLPERGVTFIYGVSQQVCMCNVLQSSF